MIDHSSNGSTSCIIFIILILILIISHSHVTHLLAVSLYHPEILQQTKPRKTRSLHSIPGGTEVPCSGPGSARFHRYDVTLFLTPV
jgi:ribulose-5-phosphate 4-epimerase/fuculose-1-phosphate aldolase